MKKTMTINDIKRYIESLRKTIIVAKLNYEIWWIYREKHNLELYLDVLNDYPMFFQTSLHAHFVAMIIALSRLYETRKDTINIFQVKEILKKYNMLSENQVKIIESNIEQVKPLWKKVFLIRNKYFAHQSLDFDTSFREANVTPNQLRQFIQDTEKILNSITNFLWRDTHAFNLSATDDVKNLLNDLKRINDNLQ